MKLPTRLQPLVLLACLAPAACMTESQSQSPGRKTAIVTRTLPVRGWEVRDDGRLAGSVLLYTEPGHEHTGYYSVRNSQGQVLGMVDFEGRAWRYRLHEEELEWLGTGTVVEGVRRILGTSALALLESAELGSLSGQPSDPH
jgi:hypothetical protein